MRAGEGTPRAGEAAREIGRECLAVRVRLLSRAVTRIYDAALRRHGLTVAQLNLLTALANHQPLAAGHLARLLSMEISTLSRNARVLEEDGLLAVERAEHGNGRVLALTAAGEAKLGEIYPAWQAAQMQARELMGADATVSIMELVDRMQAEPLARALALGG